MLLASEEKISTPRLAERGGILLRDCEHNEHVKQGLNPTSRLHLLLCYWPSRFLDLRAAVTVVTLFLLNLPDDKIAQLQNAFIIKYAPQKYRKYMQRRRLLGYRGIFYIFQNL